MTTVLRVTGGRPLRGRLRVPGDKSISHRALLLAALADGTSVVRGLSTGDDVARTRAAVGLLGAAVEGQTVTGGRTRLREPEDVIDVGNSGTTMRLLAGVCATVPGLAVLTGDASIRRRPMDRVTSPLRRMGADIDGRDGGRLPPLVVRGGDLKGIEYALPVPSAQVKAAVLFAGLAAEGET
ncbi:MAG: 3-phosphoshikimate 1-carboxyvinyltransferase, partial [Acidimicrobiales bacterium]